MTQESGTRPTAVPEVAAVCGLPCEPCSLYIGTHHDPARLPTLAARWGLPVEVMHCDGCRAERRSFYCQTCELFTCAAQRGHAFCIECGEYPCKALSEFRSQAPHRIEIYENLERIRDAGVDDWMAEVRARYGCPSCGTLNSAYDLACRSCGHTPSCAYVAAHEAEIKERLSQL